MAENASAPASQRERIKAELASLKVFQGRVDELLTTFGESEATPTRIADDRLEQAHLGEGFTAAKRFYDVYDGVHADLMTLSAAGRPDRGADRGGAGRPRRLRGHRRRRPGPHVGDPGETAAAPRPPQGPPRAAGPGRTAAR
ncbi:hypothetical protein ACFQ2B_20060 [Streptomyces stramineus]